MAARSDSFTLVQGKARRKDQGLFATSLSGVSGCVCACAVLVLVLVLCARCLRHSPRAALRAAARSWSLRPSPFPFFFFLSTPSPAAALPPPPPPPLPSTRSADRPSSLAVACLPAGRRGARQRGAATRPPATAIIMWGQPSLIWPDEVFFAVTCLGSGRARAPRRDGHDGAAALLVWAGRRSAAASPDRSSVGSGLLAGIREHQHIHTHTSLLGLSLSRARARTHVRVTLFLFIIWGREERGCAAGTRVSGNKPCPALPLAPSPALFFPHTLH